MFNFFRKNKKEQFVDVESYIFNTDLERKTICLNSFFSNPSIFLDMKLMGGDRNRFVENNFFNLRYMGLTEDFWNKNKSKYLPLMKESLEFGYDIVDGESYNNIFNEFTVNAPPHAWNLVRIVGVTQEAYTLNYIDFETAKRNINLLGEKLIENYTSWEQVATDFLLGKLEFNNLKELQGENTEVFTNISDITIMIDLLFNDKDSPLNRCLFTSDENLTEASDNIFNNILSRSKRGRNIMSVYKQVYGWDPFVLIENHPSMDEKETNTYNFIKSNLKLDIDEEIIYIHAFPSGKPEKSNISFILTDKNIITVLNKKARINGDYVRIPLSDIHENSLQLNDEKLFNELLINGKAVNEDLSLNSAKDFVQYREILNDIISFIKKG
ncbi:hypothetical protein CLPUN_48340 [Clostridium puniceum]|uniref:DUF1266 domain-containing protein n=1 Tax=Clostridium puniceum TaxID=29367 RepID=A0A1S8T2Q0_9CLOT|nr:DUF1266 domain-containing protein [Clostridium puniceum]OOM72067.1 hypothetical protein CLPUN_48340 [Clostridium puniceum]